MMNQQIAWKSILVEALAIVASILLAFGIQAWWDGRQERESEQIMLRSLLNDLTEKQTTLENSRRFNDAVLESATILFTEFAEPSLRLDQVELDTQIAGIMWYNTQGRWSSAPIDSLIVGGNISIISNPLLRQELASIQLSLNNLKRFSQGDEHFYFDILVPFMTKNASLSQLRQYQAYVPGLPERNYESLTINSLDTYDHSTLLSNLVFQNLVDQRVNQISDFINIGYTGFEEKLAKAISLIETELEH